MAEKLPGPSGLRGADTDTATTARQSANRPGSSSDVPVYEETLPENDDEDVKAASDTDMGFIGSLEPSAQDVIGELIMQTLGGRSYRREQRAACSRMVSEMYSSSRHR